MNPFPSEPVAPREFIEEVIPALFAGMDLDSDVEALDFKLGIRLEGEDGGDWTLHFIAGELGIADGLADDCAVTVVQSVADWRAGLWQGRPGLVGDAVERLIDGSGSTLRLAGLAGAPANPKALRELENLPGRIDAIIEAGDSRANPAWRIAIQIGPGPIAETPNATLQIGAEESEALRRGELHPLEALITGQLRLEGDLGLILALQGIAMAASLPPPPGI